VNKCDEALPENIDRVEAAVRRLNPRAEIHRCDSPVTVEHPELIAGKRVVVVEDGPTLTHGSMTFGAGVVAARGSGVAAIVDPSGDAVGSLVETYAKYPNARGILPAMGYSPGQVHDLQATLEAVDADAIVSGTPIDLTRVLTVSKPMVRAHYDLRERVPGLLEAALDRMLAGRNSQA
ncbi:MAG TPA: GTPase, partial [Dermatophilaceae bacterium]|nr:GTPase [Dermatophilaceae bacterium]